VTSEGRTAKQTTKRFAWSCSNGEWLGLCCSNKQWLQQEVIFMLIVFKTANTASLFHRDGGTDVTIQIPDVQKFQNELDFAREMFFRTEADELKDAM